MLMKDFQKPDFAKIFDWAPGIFLVLLPDAPRFTIVAANRARLKATKSKDQQIGRGLFDMFPDNPDDPEASGVQNLRHSLEEVLKTGKPDTMAVQKYDIPRPESEGGGFEERYWSPINSPVFDENGNVLYIIHQVEDVTEYILLKRQGSAQLKLTNDLQQKIHKAEEEVFVRAQEIQKAHLKLQKSYEEIRQLYIQNKELEKLKSQFFANVSHELRTPLTLILGPLELILSSDSLSNQHRTHLHLIQRNAEILLKHVNDLLDVSRIDAGAMTINYSELNLAKYFRIIAGNFESGMESKSIHLSVKSPDLLNAQVDEDKTQRILMNLLSNAMKFVQPGGWVECELKKKGQKVIISVADNGPGIRPELREAVFERFRQVESGLTRSVGGTGLGLAIVKDFVELHQGTIKITDTPGGGATFIIELPIFAPAGVPVKKGEYNVQAKSSKIGIVEPPKKKSTLRKSNLPLVLIVEDNSDMREFISITLSEQFQIMTAENGLDGLNKLKTAVPDLILTDIMMPKMSGDQMIERIRKSEKFKDVPIILLTAKIDYELKLKLLGDGCQDYLSKPFSQKELLIRVHNFVTMKKSKEILSSELSTKSNDIFSLSRELTLRKRELQSTLETISIAKEQAERASEMKTRLLTIISHELRTPLTTLMLAIGIIQKKNPTVKKSQYFQNVHKSSIRLKELIDQMIDFANFQSGKLSIQETFINPQKVVIDVVEELNFSAESKGLELKVFAPDDTRPILADPRLIKIILYNIISNSIKFTSKGVITIRSLIADNNLRFEVTDTGAGISQNDLKIIFEPFKQLEPLQHKGSIGVGLGLAFVKGIVESLKGSCIVESKLGVGTKFVVQIPIQEHQEFIYK